MDPKKLNWLNLEDPDQVTWALRYLAGKGFGANPGGIDPDNRRRLESILWGLSDAKCEELKLKERMGGAWYQKSMHLRKGRAKQLYSFRLNPSAKAALDQIAERTRSLKNETLEQILLRAGDLEEHYLDEMKKAKEELKQTKRAIDEKHLNGLQLNISRLEKYIGTLYEQCKLFYEIIRYQPDRDATSEIVNLTNLENLIDQHETKMKKFGFEVPSKPRKKHSKQALNRTPATNTSNNRGETHRAPTSEMSAMDEGLEERNQALMQQNTALSNEIEILKKRIKELEAKEDSLLDIDSPPWPITDLEPKKPTYENAPTAQPSLESLSNDTALTDNAEEATTQVQAKTESRGSAEKANSSRRITVNPEQNLARTKRVQPTPRTVFTKGKNDKRNH